MASRVLYLLVLLGAVDLRAGPHPHKNVLVLVSDEPNLPAVSIGLEALRTQLNKDDPAAVSLFTEYLDLNRFESPDYRDEILRWHQRKYRSVPLDLILCVSMAALRLTLTEHDRLWPGVPMGFVGIDVSDLDGMKLPPDVRGVATQTDFEGTARLALKLLPDTKHVAVVSGSAQRDQLAHRQMISIVNNLPTRLDVIDLGGLSFEDLEKRLSSLPKETIVLCTTITQDRNGRRIVPRDAIAALAPKTNAPVFSAVGTYMGTGIVGGNLLDYQVVGRDAAILSQQILYKELRESAQMVQSHGNQIKLDWRQLRRWNIPDDRIPAGSAVLFRTPTLWEEHRTGILIIACFIAVQAFLISWLSVERRNLASARREMVHLSSRLISAQDEERARIARELHDDFSQRLALFSIEIDQIREEVHGGAADRALQSLTEKAAAVGADLHGLAHELYPSKLHHLGLLPVTRDFCREVELRSGVDVDITMNNWPPDLEKNVTLCLYRIVQESLQNVVRHSQAHRASVKFTGRDHEISLTIADDGCGFDPAGVPEGCGLGLAGMRERLRAVQGRIRVHSKPGAGTRIEVSIPMSEIKSGRLLEKSTA